MPEKVSEELWFEILAAHPLSDRHHALIDRFHTLEQQFADGEASPIQIEQARIDLLQALQRPSAHLRG